ncbi:MAG: hypothetical protein K8R48_09950 [Alphaproteobacteria bacterium]|nr:hypothetical protein [Alphaproteobacteria bacterium]
MPQLQWTRLGREQAHKVLEQLSTRRDAVVFSKDVTEVSSCHLPFYTNYWLFRLVNYATMPTFSLTYFSDGTDYICLDGTANPVYTVNEKSPIQLTEKNVLQYLEFFFGNVQGSEGDVFLIKDPARVPFMSALNPAQQQGVTANVKPVTVVTDSTQNFRVRGTLYYGGELITSTVVVTPAGKITFQDQIPVLSGVYLPESPYSEAWLEG